MKFSRGKAMWLLRNAPGQKPSASPRLGGEDPSRLDVLWAWLVFHAFALWSSLRRWWIFKTVCAWCKPPRRVSGAPWARTTSHVMCPACERRVRAEIEQKIRQRLSGAQPRTVIGSGNLPPGEDHETRAAVAPVSNLELKNSGKD